MMNSEKEMYRLHAKLPIYARHIADAERIIAKTLADHAGLWGVGASGGKDSTVLSHLAWSAGWRGPLYHFWSDETPVENIALVHALGNRMALPVITVKVPGAWDVYDQCGRFFTVPQTTDEKRAVRAMLTGYKEGAERGALDAGMVGLFWGMRAEESRARAITINKYGTIYRAGGRQTWTSLPLSRWTGRDIWAYLIAHDLPWLDIYDDGDFASRERQRSETTWLAAPGIWRYGQGQRMRETAPEAWAALCRRWPNLRDYG